MGKIIKFKEDVEEMVNRMKKYKVELRDRYVLIYGANVELSQDAEDYAKSEGIKIHRDIELASDHLILMRKDDYNMFHTKGENK